MAIVLGPRLGVIRSAAAREYWLPQALDVYRLIDALLMGTVLDKDLATPPGSPVDGALYIVAGSPTGAWTGHAKAIAYWDATMAAWFFYAPLEGFTVWVCDENLPYTYDGSAWGIAPSGNAATLQTHPAADFVLASLLGAVSGVATLDGSGKVPSSQLPAAILGALSYQGTWNATTNSPTIPAAASGNKGWYYKVATAGSTSIDGITDWKIGDWIVSNGTTWDKVDNTEQFNGDFTGLTGSISAAQVPAALLKEPLFFPLDGQGSVLSTTNPAVVEPLYIRDASHLKGWVIIGDVSGSLTVDLQVASYATGALSFSTLGATNPALSSAQGNKNLGLNVAISADRFLKPVITGTPTSTTRAYLYLFITPD